MPPDPANRPVGKWKPGPVTLNPDTFKLHWQDVERLHDALGGDPATEEAILAHLRVKMGTDDFFSMRPATAQRILNNPAAFIQDATGRQRELL